MRLQVARAQKPSLSQHLVDVDQFAWADAVSMVTHQKDGHVLVDGGQETAHDLVVKLVRVRDHVLEGVAICETGVVGIEGVPEEVPNCVECRPIYEKEVPLAPLHQLERKLGVGTGQLSEFSEVLGHPRRAWLWEPAYTRQNGRGGVVFQDVGWVGLHVHHV